MCVRQVTFLDRLFRFCCSLQRLVPYLIAVACLLAAIATSAAERRFERTSTVAGVEGAVVLDIVQDDLGFVWFGTSEGLYRFDGYSSRIFSAGKDSDGSLHSNRVSSLLLSRNGTLWVGTRGGGVSRYDAATQTFVAFRHQPDNPLSLAHDDVLDLTEDAEGRIWVATARQGLSRLDDPLTDAGTFQHFVHDPDNPKSLSDDRTRTLLFDQSGSLWVGTMGGINRVGDPLAQNPEFEAYRHDPQRLGSLPDDEVWSLKQDSEGNLWAGMWGGGLARLDNPDAVPMDATFTRFAADPDDSTSLSDNRVMRIFEDRAGSLWIATLSGLNELTAAQRLGSNPRFQRSVHDPRWDFSLSSGGIHAIFEDQRGDLWIGTDEGVDRLDRRVQQVESYRFQPGLEGGLSDYPWDALIDRNGVLWVAHGSGLNRIERPSDSLEVAQVLNIRFAPEINGVKEGAAYSLLEDRFGYLWFTTFDGLVGMAPAQQAQDQPALLKYLEGLSSNAVLSLFEDEVGALWVGTYRGLHRVERDETGAPIGFPEYHGRVDEKDRLQGSANAIAADASGRLWIGTYSGLYEVDSATKRAVLHMPDIRKSDALSNEFIETLLLDSQDRLWVGTRSGELNLHLGEGRFEQIGVQQGLRSNTVHSIAEYGGYLWLATSRGLVRLDPETQTLSSLGVDKGVSANEVFKVRSRPGGLLVVASPAVDLLQSLSAGQTASSQPVVLSGLRIRNRPVVPGTALLPQALERMNEIVFDRSHDLVTFEFGSLDYRRAQSVAYRYRLENLHNDWIETTAQDRRAVFSTLPPGAYTFRVQASGDGSFDQPAESSIRVVMVPAWWQTGWARLLALITLLVAVVAIPILRLATARVQTRRLEEQVLKRTSDLAAANRRLEELATTDSTTGLFNRRRFLEAVSATQAAMRRHQRTAAIALADIDDFKAVNDTWGHEAGDRVLCVVAERLADSIREVDDLARWGGEEFIFLFPETDLNGALIIAEKIRDAVSSRPIVWNGRDLAVTITIGVTTMEPGDEFHARVAAADAALYGGKRTGKNKVVG